MLKVVLREWWILILLCTTITYSQQKEFIVIAGGSYGGNYSKAAEFLTKYYRNKNPEKSFITIGITNSLN